MKVIVPQYAAAQLAALRRAAPKVDFAICADDVEALAQVGDAQASIGFVGESLCATGRKLRWLQAESAGVDAILRHVPKRIILTSARGAYAEPLAEHHLALMLGLARRVTSQRRDADFRVLSGATLLIVGHGATGQALGKKAQALGMRLETKLSRAALARADFVAICCPLTPKTRGLIGAAELAAMKPTAFLTNAARGAIVQTDALTAALQNGELAGAGLDVTEPEPLPASHPLWQMENVILTPHIGGYSPNADAQVFAIVLENVRRFARGRPLLNVVDRRKGY